MHEYGYLAGLGNDDKKKRIIMIKRRNELKRIRYF